MLRRTLLPAIACLGLALAYVVPALAQEEDDDDTADLSFEQKLIHQFMTGLGAKSGRERGITYRERSPLVLPPQMTLPEPRKGGVALAPNWPKDPDEQARKQAAELAKQPRLTPEEYGRPLLPSELAKGRVAASRNPQAVDDRDPGRALLPSELGYRGGLFGSILTPQKQETVTFTGEPRRGSLTAPPPGYQTPSPAYPYGIGVPKSGQTASEQNPVGNTQR